MSRLAALFLAVACASGCAPPPPQFADPYMLSDRVAPREPQRAFVAAPQAATRPAAGGVAPSDDLTPEPWIEVRTKHFIVRSDQSEALARSAAEEFEGDYAMLRDALVGDETVGFAPTEVLLFATRAESVAITRHVSGGQFQPALPQDIEGLSRITVFGRSTPSRVEGFKHEITHMLVSRFLGNVPRWLNEGIAQFYSTTRVENGVLVLGSPLLEFGFTALDWHAERTADGMRNMVPFSAMPSASDLFAAPASEWFLSTTPTQAEHKQQIGLYMSAYSLVHLLHNGPQVYRDRLQEILHALSRNDDPDAVLRRYLPPENELNGDLARYVRQPTWLVRRRAYVSLPIENVLVHRLDDVENLSLQIRLSMPWTPSAAAAWDAALGEAISKGTWRPELLMWRALVSWRDNPERARAVLEAALVSKPDEPRLLFALASVCVGELSLRGDHRVAMATLLSISKRFADRAIAPTAMALASDVMRTTKRPGPALELAERAVARDPSCGACFRVLAAVLVDQKRPLDALAAAQRAVNLYGHAGAPPVLLAELDKIRAAAVRATAQKKPPAAPRRTGDSPYE